MTTTMHVTGTWTRNGVPATGRVEFVANDQRFANGGQIVESATVSVALVAGMCAVDLVRCTTGYTVCEQIDGAFPVRYEIDDQVGPVDLSAA